MIVTKSQATFTKAMRHAALSYFEQRTLFIDFMAEMQRLLAFHYSQAWQEGEQACGFTPGERTDAQRQRLQSEVARDLKNVYGLAEYIEGQTAKLKAGGMKTILWRGVSTRLEVWANRYNAVRSTAQTIVCADGKFRWVYGDTVDHCNDCSNYAGRVYRGSTWRAAGALPQSGNLECGGWRCDCCLEPTRAAITPGRPPAPTGG